MAKSDKAKKQPGTKEVAKTNGLSAIARARDAANKVLGKIDWRVPLDPELFVESHPHLPTGSMIIDYLIGGQPNRNGIKPCPGLPRGKVTQLWGHEAAGKTTLALTAAATTCAAGGSVLYVDWENDIVPDYALALGVPIGDPDRFELAQPDTMEDGLKIIKAYALAGVDLIVIDSVGAAIPAAIREKGLEGTGEQHRVGLAAQRWSEFLPDIKNDIKRHNNVLLGISQVRAKIGMNNPGGPTSEPQGGFAWKYYAGLRMELRKIQSEKSKQVNALTNKTEERVHGGIINAKMVKCKLSSSQGREEKFYIRQGEGIDDVRSVIEIAINHHIIKKAGSWLVYEEDKWQGMEGVRRFFNENNQALNDLIGKVRPHLTPKAASEAPEADVDDPSGDELDEMIRSAGNEEEEGSA